MKIVVSWSTGKDSAWTLHTLRAQHPGCTAALLTTINEAFDRVAMHAVRRTLVTAQAEAAGLPLYAIDLPWPCSNEVYESRMADAVRRLEADGFTHIAFGDLFLEDVRRYREDRLAGTGLTPLFPLWKTKSTRELADEMIDGGLRARLTCVDPRVLPAVVRRPCSSTARCSPTCRQASTRAARTASSTRSSGTARCSPAPLHVEIGERVERDGFVFADVVPVAACGTGLTAGHWKLRPRCPSPAASSA